MSQVPGITAKHAIITPECRAGRTDLGAFDEALDRLRTEYLKVLDLRGEEGPANYHLVLSVEGLEPAKPSSRLTADPEDPRLAPYRGKGHDDAPVPQQDVYLVLPEEERAKGFVRPVRHTYRHVGPPGPTYDLVDLDDEQRSRYADAGYVKFEPYPEGAHGSAIGRCWTQEDLDAKGCQATTTMGQQLAETYARNPWFYGGTYCAHCRMHRPLNEFVWDEGGESLDPERWPDDLKVDVRALTKENAR